jgi:uncharacterized HAD superfamily protein
MDRDRPIAAVTERVRRLSHDHRIVIFTGRPDEYRQRTEAWLRKHGIAYDQLLMRRRGDHRPDYIAKREMLEELNGQHVALAIDDREPVCQMLRELGINVIQVESGEENKQVNEAYREKPDNA